MSITSELSDDAFVSAIHHLTELSALIEREVGQKPSIREFCDVITLAIRSTAVELFADANNLSLTNLEPRLSRSTKIVLRKGDIVAVPSNHGGFYHSIYLGKFGRFGDQFGFFRGRQATNRFKGLSTTKALGAVFTGLESLVNGKWIVVAHCPELLALFPRAGERYHEKRNWPNKDDPAIGPYGAAELVDGAMRNISKKEADVLGITTGVYRQSISNELIETLFIDPMEGLIAKRREGRNRG